MIDATDKSPSWRRFGRDIAIRFIAHFCLLVGAWVALLFYGEMKRPFASLGAHRSDEWLSLYPWVERWFHFLTDLGTASLPGLLTLACMAVGWCLLAVAPPLWLALLLSGLSTFLGGLFALSPIPERTSSWLLWAGSQTPRNIQLVFIVVAGLLSIGYLWLRMTRQYEHLNRERLALTPSEEDFAVRALVQSTLLLLVTVASGLLLWQVANLRPVPAIADADAREEKPTVLVLAVDSDVHARILKTRWGEPFFKSWVVFGSPDINQKFDEILQCRYPIRLVGQTTLKRTKKSSEVNDFFVPAALRHDGYSVGLLHAAVPGEESYALKALSRQYAHIKLFRRFGLLMPSRVFYTPDVILSQIREELTLAVNAGKPAFLTASLMSRGERPPSTEDISQFAIFLEALKEHYWMRNMMVILLELPHGSQEKRAETLSLGGTSAFVSFWATGALSDSVSNLLPLKLVRGIDLGASLGARLRLSSILGQCDGVALFDVTERPSVFPREFVYQEMDVSREGQGIFRRRGWLTGDGYRLELEETHEGVQVSAYKYSLKDGVYNRSWAPVNEVAVGDAAIKTELNRQLDEFLRGVGVEILNLGNGRTAYSEPFKRIKLLEQ